MQRNRLLEVYNLVRYLLVRAATRRGSRRADTDRARNRGLPGATPRCRRRSEDPRRIATRRSRLRARDLLSDPASQQTRRPPTGQGATKKESDHERRNDVPSADRRGATALGPAGGGTAARPGLARIGARGARGAGWERLLPARSLGSVPAGRPRRQRPERRQLAERRRHRRDAVSRGRVRRGRGSGSHLRAAARGDDRFEGALHDRDRVGARDRDREHPVQLLVYRRA